MVHHSIDDLLEFPDDARRQAGFQLGKVQAGLDPDGCKPSDDVGAGTREIRIRDANGAFRVMYVARTRALPKRVIAQWSTRKR